MGHTPGPWEWLEDKFNGGYSGLVAPRTGKEVLFPNHRNDGDDGDAWFEDFPNGADRNLIAAAPELYEALKDAVKQFGYALPSDCVDRYKAALKKARGK